MSGFVQIIDYRSSRIDEIRALVEEMRASSGDSPGVRGVATADRDTPNRYVTIVEFDSYEAAMANSSRPEISKFASRMAELCDGPPTFTNLDVKDSWVS